MEYATTSTGGVIYDERLQANREEHAKTVYAQRKYCLHVNEPFKVHNHFELRHDEQWQQVNDASVNMGSQITVINEIRSLLDSLKSEVHQICTTEHGKRQWRNHTQRNHPLHKAPALLREQYGCPHTSQAFCKFYEILTRFPRIIQPRSKIFRSFHLCEAPGHFLSSLDRFLSVFHANLDWAWEANSLNPHSESVSACDMLLDDDVIIANPTKWRFGPDGSGDITKWDGAYLRQISGNGFDLVTADGSFYMQDDPNGQELAMLTLLHAETNVALRLLRIGGSFVIKLYSMLLPETRRLVLDIASRFRYCSIFKPMCSKSGNSERYLVAQGFEHKQSLRNHVAYGALMCKCEEYFSALQAQAIRFNLDTFNQHHEEELAYFGERVTNLFLQKIHAGYINQVGRERLVEVDVVDNGNPWKYLFGTNYVERIRALTNTAAARELLLAEVQGLCMEMSETDIPDSVDAEWSKEELDFLYAVDKDRPLEMAEIFRVVVCGPAISNIRHSLFTEPDLLHAALQLSPDVTLVDLCGIGGPQQQSKYTRGLVKALKADFKQNAVVYTSGWATCVCGKWPIYDPETLRESNIYLFSVDASQMRSSRDWILFLKAIIDRGQELASVEIHWLDVANPPLVLSRFSASLLAFFTVLFKQFRFSHERQCIVTFSMPEVLNIGKKEALKVTPKLK